MPAPFKFLTLTNLDFESNLAYGSGFPRKPALVNLCRRWRYLLRLLPQAQNVLCLDPFHPYPLPATATLSDSIALLPWGWSPRARHLAHQIGLRPVIPSLQAIRLANDKRTSHALEHQWGTALPHSCLITSLEQLTRVLATCPHPWVLKHPLGVSALEQLKGDAGQLSQAASAWAKRRLSSGWTLIFEPWLEKAQAFSLHFDITPHGEIAFVGSCLMLTNKQGVFRGHRIIPQAPDEACLGIGEKVCQYLWDQGYWGPVGIDGLRGQLGGKPWLRALMEINARLSFGRLALCLGAFLPTGWCYEWRHATSQVPNILVPALPSGPGPHLSTGIYRLPKIADPHQTSGSLVLIAPTSIELERLSTSYLEPPAPQTF